MDKQYYVYFLANWNNKVLYVGVTGNLKKRIYEHKNKFVEGFTEKYIVDKLVYFEITQDVNSAIVRNLPGNLAQPRYERQTVSLHERTPQAMPKHR